MIEKMISPFECDGNWYRANLHCHTTVSDGAESIETRIKDYKNAGYDILAMTDHSISSDVRGLSTKDFLVLSGMEIHPLHDGGKEKYHLICLDVPANIDIPPDSDVKTQVRLVKEAGGEVIFGHPYWCGLDANDIIELDVCIAIEIYNTICDVKNGKAYSMVQWDDVLAAGRIIGAVAADDTHDERALFGGWTYIKAAELTNEAIMGALRTGCYYASRGPKIKHFAIKDGKAILECDPVVSVHFSGYAWNGMSFHANANEPITTAEYTMNKNGKYIRATVIDDKGRQAWTNPIMYDPWTD